MRVGGCDCGGGPGRAGWEAGAGRVWLEGEGRRVGAAGKLCRLCSNPKQEAVGVAIAQNTLLPFATAPATAATATDLHANRPHHHAAGIIFYAAYTGEIESILRTMAEVKYGGTHCPHLLLLSLSLPCWLLLPPPPLAGAGWEEDGNLPPPARPPARSPARPPARPHISHPSTHPAHHLAASWSQVQPAPPLPLAGSLCCGRAFLHDAPGGEQRADGRGGRVLLPHQLSLHDAPPLPDSPWHTVMYSPETSWSDFCPAWLLLQVGVPPLTARACQACGCTQQVFFQFL